MVSSVGFVKFPATWNLGRVSWVAAGGAVVGLFVAALTLPGGNDLFLFYLPFAQGCLTCGYVPYFAAFTLWPLAFLPSGMEWPFLVLASALGWLGLCYALKVNPLVILLAFPMLGELWLGQVDLVLAAGIVLALLSKNPYVRGVGIAMAAVKPQVTWLVILALLWRDTQWKKMLVAPMAMGLASLAVFGPTWPLEWLRSSGGLPVHTWRIASMAIWPLGATLVWLPFVIGDRRERIGLAAIVGSIATPFVGVYTYSIPLMLGNYPWWVVLVSYVWLLARPFAGNFDMGFAWILPVTLLVLRLTPIIRGLRRPPEIA